LDVTYQTLYLFIYLIITAQGELVTDIPVGDGNVANLFFTVQQSYTFYLFSNAAWISAFSAVYTKMLEHGDHTLQSIHD
jgi:hypothetical protein